VQYRYFSTDISVTSRRLRKRCVCCGVAFTLLIIAPAGRLCRAFFFLVSFAEVFQVLRQNLLIMAITKDGKQLYKFNTQVLVRISSGIREIFKKLRLKVRCVSRFMAVAHLAF